MTQEVETKVASLLLRRLARLHDELLEGSRPNHAAAVLLAVERVENQERHLRRAGARIAELRRALDAECIARDRAEQQRDALLLVIGNEIHNRENSHGANAVANHAALAVAEPE